MAKIAFVLPMYGKYVYAQRAALSFWKYLDPEHEGIVIAVDDASPQYAQQDWTLWRQGMPADRLVFQAFQVNRGLTRGWNWGLATAKTLGCDYAIAGNSDVLFTPCWAQGLLAATEAGFRLVGPVTNAPGYSNRNRQHVKNFFKNHAKFQDDPVELARIAAALHSQHLSQPPREDHINGFFMWASVRDWWQGSFDMAHVFDPSKKMTGNEDELQKRWRSRGWKIGFTPASYIFHYRAVTRGEAYKSEGWQRLTDPYRSV